jgi:hypothetical protein
MIYAKARAALAVVKQLNRNEALAGFYTIVDALGGNGVKFWRHDRE